MDICHIFAGGVRASEIARRLRVTGYDEDRIEEVDSLDGLLAAIEKQDSQHAYILATYTAMLELRDILAQQNAVGKEMK